MYGNKTVTVLYNGAGAKEGFFDFACKCDKCACQVECRQDCCDTAIRLCGQSPLCDAVSLNAPNKASATWATLKEK